MSLSYQISSPVVNVNIWPFTPYFVTNSKIVQLPPASTVIGKSFLVRDFIGVAGSEFVPYTINVSTTGIDTVDYAVIKPVINPIQLGTPFESIQLIAQSTTNYAILSRSLFNTL